LDFILINYIASWPFFRVAEAEPVEPQLLAGAGAEIFGLAPAPSSANVKLYKMLQKTLNFSYKNWKFSLKL
jgi:hypothetical protein